MRTNETELSRELRAMSRMSTIALVEEPTVRATRAAWPPKNALAVDKNNVWAIIIASYPGDCKRCGGKLVRGQKIVIADDRRTFHTHCVRKLVFEPTERGLRRKRANQGRSRKRAA
jgi:hypothetical protein